MRLTFSLPTVYHDETLYSHLSALSVSGLLGWSIDTDLHAEFPERESLADEEVDAVAAHVAAYVHMPTWTAVRALRSPLLDEADIQFNKALDTGTPTAPISTYRQALRDVTKQSDPLNVAWPTKPW